MGERWMPEHVVALAPDPGAAAAARRLAVPARWQALGCNDDAVWGLCHGTSAEPYHVVVELAEPTSRCTCPSRKLPCKHAVGLLLMWAHDHVPAGVTQPSFAATWLARRARRLAQSYPGPTDAAPASDLLPQPSAAASVAPPAPADPTTRVQLDGSGGDTKGSVADDPPTPAVEALNDHPPAPPDRRVSERTARVHAGLEELDRWLADCVRTGLAAPDLARYDSWDALAARLVDAQAPSLANRVRRLAGRVGTSPGWHEQVLAELGVLHVLAVAGRRAATLPDHLGDGVRTAVGWAVRRDDVLDTAPLTDRWWVAGRSDSHEDRLVVRRTWLRGRTSLRWAMILSFAAYGQALDATLPVGASFCADVHYYPAACPLRALVSVVHEPPVPDPAAPPAVSVLAACADIGRALADEPWLERWPVTVRAAPTRDRSRWMLADHTGALPLADSSTGPSGLPALVALSGGEPLPVTAEWTVDGLLPVAAHAGHRSVDLGPEGPWGRA
jgi:hypothetical protein